MWDIHRRKPSADTYWFSSVAKANSEVSMGEYGLR